MFILKEMDELWERFSAKAYQPNILDGKTKELIAVSNSVVADCLPCLEYHYKRAVKAGASQDEIAESIAVAMSISAGSKKAKYLPVITRLEANQGSEISQRNQPDAAGGPDGAQRISFQEEK